MAVAFFMGSCSSPTVWMENEDEWGYKEKFEFNIQDSLKSGAYYRYFPNGILYEEANYKGGILEGERKLFHEEGYLEVKENYSVGKFEGEWVRYWPDGSIKLEGQYREDEMIGQWRKYYEGGKLSEITHFVNNQENGDFIEYYDNGNIKAKGQYLDGDFEEGELLLYNEEGELAKRMNCEKGICVTLWEKVEL